MVYRLSFDLVVRKAGGKRYQNDTFVGERGIAIVWTCCWQAFLPAQSIIGSTIRRAR